MEQKVVLDKTDGTQPLRNHTAALVLGILSIFPGCFLYGILGIILGVIALAISSNEWRMVKANRAAYYPPHVSSLQAGRTCAIVGLSLSAVWILIIIFYVVILGSAFMGLGAAMEGIQ